MQRTSFSIDFRRSSSLTTQLSSESTSSFCSWSRAASAVFFSSCCFVTASSVCNKRVPRELVVAGGRVCPGTSCCKPKALSHHILYITEAR